MNEWSNLADNNRCNFAARTSGILNNCGTICLGIKGHNKPEGFNKTPEGFRETLSVFAQYVADNFGSSKFDCHDVTFHYSWLRTHELRSPISDHAKKNLKNISDNHAGPAAVRDECGERINALFKNIQKFEDITGPIDFIPSSFTFYPEENLNNWS